VSLSLYPFSLAPAPFDIVWCCFPEIENPKIPGPKARPGLVRQSFQDEEGNAWVRVIYGTSKDPYRSSPYDFNVAQLSEMDMCGLKQATRFQLDKQMRLPWSREYFACLTGKPTPIIGHMSPHLQRLFQEQASWLQNEIGRDIPDIE
jgi:hypothetical protein